MTIYDLSLLIANVALSFGAAVLPAARLVFSRQGSGRGKMVAVLTTHVCLIVLVGICANGARIAGYRDYQFAWLALYPLNALMLIVYIVVRRKERARREVGEWGRV